MPFDRAKRLAEYSDVEEPVDLLKRRPTKAKRNRDWERRTNYLVATYRGIPPELQREIKEVAAELGVPVGDVARAFLEHGLRAYRDGELTLERHLAVGRWTLYPGTIEEIRAKSGGRLRW